MRRSLIIAGFAALATIASMATPASASTLSASDAEMCKYLELANETTCEEFESVQLLLKQRAAEAEAATTVDPEATGSITANDHETYWPMAVPDLR